MRHDLPTGTVTFLFTDIEGSTTLLRDLGAKAYADLLGEHHSLLREACATHQGVEVDTQGDAFFMAFSTAGDALAAAAEAQRALSSHRVHVRMGLHTGAPHLTAHGYVGIDVHKAARIAAAGHGGQVLLSKATRELVDVGVTDSGFGETVRASPSDNFFEALYPWPERITAVGVTELERFASAFPSVRTVHADGRELPFADGEFELGFSNAVVEHVGGREAQQQFVHELCRVATRVFVTTPNRWFPIEVHTLVPVVHWLPRPASRRLVRGLEGIELLGPREFASLFPFPVRVVNTGLTLIAIGPDAE